MPSIGDRLWEMGKSPSQHMALLTLGLASILVAALLASAMSVAGASGALIMSASALAAIGGFFLVVALFVGAYASSGDSVPAVVWRVAQLLVAALVLITIFA
ncbi:MAG: hypothetical protein A3K68_03900 [Euryarchaeota archaeon RBG_16_68_13]|nr:MAG: hypothetical protein A3K68_03900 [Euryarchaeota archaeon RBG_16_68_13]